MSGANLMPVPIVQMGLVEKLVVAEQSQPYIQQLAAQDIARQAIKEEADRVPQVDFTEHGKKIRDREGGRGKRERRHASGQSRSDEQEQNEQGENGPSKANPWAGQIVNMKI